MRVFVRLAIVVCALWAIDTYAFGGTYRQALWQEARYQGQTVKHDVRRLLRKLNLASSRGSGVLAEDRQIGKGYQYFAAKNAGTPNL
jgi:hypothetical protein